MSLVGTLQPVGVRIEGAVASRSMQCNFEMKQIVCEAEGKRVAQPVQGRYAFFLPSPWLVGAVVRRASRQPDAVTPITLVRFLGIREEGPVLGTIEAKVRYVGEDEIEVAGARYQADIFELQPDPYPRLLIWLARGSGMPVAMQDANKPEQRIELVELKGKL